LESSLNPINMIRKLGGAAMSMSRELQDNKQVSFGLFTNLFFAILHH